MLDIACIQEIFIDADPGVLLFFYNEVGRDREKLMEKMLERSDEERLSKEAGDSARHALLQPVQQMSAPVNP